MTDRLAQLLCEEATHLAPPTPDPAAVLERGRRLRRRQRATTGLVGLAAAAVVVTTAGFVALGLPGDDAAREVGPAGPGRAAPGPAAYAVGSQVAVGDAVATVPDTVHSLHYTSAGVLVRSNPNGGASDGSGPESLTLVGFDGATTDLGTVPEGVGPATDPDRGVYVLAEADDAAAGGFVAVVRDATTGEVVQEVPLPEGRPSYWEVPPLALDGEDLYVGFRDSTAVVDLATGTAVQASALTGGIPEVLGGHTLVQSASLLSVFEARSGRSVLDVDLDADPEGFASASLSPDGRWLMVTEQGTDGAARTRLVEVATGEEVALELSDPTGWTAGGDPFAIDDRAVTTCEAATGACRSQPLPIDWPADAFPRLGGRTYES